MRKTNHYDQTSDKIYLEISANTNILKSEMIIKHNCEVDFRRLNGYDPESFLLNSKLPITNLMISTRQTKVKLILSCMMEKVDLKSGEVIAKEAAFYSKTEVNLESTNSNELLSKMKESVFESLDKFPRQGSNWRFHSVLSLDLHRVKYVPLGGSSYIPLSKFLAAKKAIINLKNEDDELFKWAITRALNPCEQKL